jgi:hypothetical protein
MSMLQPLRIPAGWRVDYNEFYAIEAASETRDHLKEDLFQATHTAGNRMLDLGWYPEADPDGAFRLCLHAGDFSGELIHRADSPDRASIVAELERLLAAVAEGEL